MPPLTLTGCAPVPLAHYLKALGILRLVSEQIDPAAKTAWAHDQFELTSALDRDGIVKFLSSSYAPTAVLTPWNGDGGFFDSSRRGARETLACFEHSKAARLTNYREAIYSIRQVLSRMGINEKPADTEKDNLLMACRNALPESALAWLDAVSVLSDEGAKFPPLLGTGGNDGSLDFSKNLMQRLSEVMDPATGRPTSESERWLHGALFANAAPGLTIKAAIGQFFPGAAGGANASSGFAASSAA